MKGKNKNGEIHLHIKRIIWGLFIIGMIIMGDSSNESIRKDEQEKNNTTIVDITINNIQEDKGIEIGNNSRARGKNSIATGRNSIAIGNDVVATGGNQTSEIIKRKLDENRDKLNEITRKEEEINRLNKELNDLKIKHHETIEAGIRVEEIMKAKENAKIDWKNKLEEYRQIVDENEEFFRIHREKINDLNSKLTGVSNLGTFNINNVDELTEKAREFKSQIESDTTLDLTLDFYKDYIVSYYKALGDLRENERILSKYSGVNFYDDSNGLNRDEIKGKYYYINYSKYYSYGLNFSRDGKIEFTLSNKYNVESSDYYTNSGIEIDESDKPRREIKIKNELTDLSTLEEWNNAKEDKSKYLKLLRKHFEINNNFFLTQEIKDRIYELNEKKLDYNIKKIEITYYQKMYEDSGKIEISWLDKKSLALKELKEIKKEIEKKLNNVYDIEKNIDKVKKEWEKENVIDIKEKNKITTETLTEELERALGISRDAINKKEKEINKKKEIADQAERNYNGINPTEKDLILSREYKKISEQLKEKGELLETSVERLKWLKDNLTLHDLNIGENAIAIGTNSLASGNSSIALGKENIVTKKNTIGLGVQNLVTGESSIGIGTGNNIFSSNSIGIGKENSINGISSVAIGEKNTINGDKNITIGVGHNIIGSNSSTIGDPNIVYGNNNHIYGNDNRVGLQDNHKNDNFILGSNIDATTVENSITLGNNSIAVSNSVSVGTMNNTRNIKFVKEGEITNTSKDAINGSQLFELGNATLNEINVEAWKNKLGINDLFSSNGLKLKKGNINSTTLSLTNNTERILGTEPLMIELKNESITLDHLNVELKEKINNINRQSESTGTGNENLDNYYTKNDIDTKINSKLDLDGINLNINNRGNLINKLTENSNIKSPIGGLVKDEDVKNYFEDIKTNEINGEIISKTLIIKGKGKLFGDNITIEINDELMKKINSKNSGSGNVNLENYIKFDDEKENSITLGKNVNGVIIKNVALPIEDKDAANKQYVDILNKQTNNLALKGVRGVSNAIAMAHLTQASSFNEFNHQLTVGSGTYGGVNAVALGFSGVSEDRRFVYKISGSVNNKGNLAAGIGFGINVGEKITKNSYNQLPRVINKKIVELENENIKIKEENKKLMNKINKLEEMILLLKKEINNVNKK